MTRPGTGASLTLGEAAARRAALEEAAEVAAARLLLDGSPGMKRGYGLAAERIARDILALLDGAAAGDVRDAEATHWQLRFQHMREERDAARARVAELEREVERLRKSRASNSDLLLAEGIARHAGRRAGAEAMREAAAKVCQRSGKHAAHNISTASEGMKMWFDGAMSGAAAIEENIRALPLPQEAGA